MPFAKYLIAGVWAAMFASGCGAQTPNETEPTFDERFVRNASDEDRSDGQKWQTALRTDCGDAVPPGRPALCMQRSGGDSYRRGEAIAAEISWRDVPSKAWLIVYLERDAPEEVNYLGATGALGPLQEVSGSGSMTFRWNGHEFPCSSPPCQREAEIGRYRLRVALYDPG